MKNIKYLLSILILSLLVIPSCDESESVVTGVVGGLIEIENPSVNYIVGNTGPYSSTIRIYQGVVKTTKIDIFKSFSSGALSSNEVLYSTINVSSTDQNSIETFSFSLSDLVDGLSLNGVPLPASDGEYQIGDFWEFKYAAITDDGRTIYQNKTTKATVATRFAGKYRAIDAAYGRIADGVIEWFYTESDWPDETVIQSIDAKTYKVLEYMGPFDLNEWYFQVDPATLEITYPAVWDEVAQTGNGQPFITCATNPADFATMDLDCSSTSNIVVLDEVSGKDRLYMTYGYYTDGSGPRTFYHVLEKIVE